MKDAVVNDLSVNYEDVRMKTFILSYETKSVRDEVICPRKSPLQEAWISGPFKSLITGENRSLYRSESCKASPTGWYRTS